MKLYPIQIIQTWNLLEDLEALNDPLSPGWRVFIKRFRVYTRQDVMIWNDLSIEERKAIQNEEIELPLRKMKKLPERVPVDRDDVLKLIYEGEVEGQKSPFEIILDKLKSNQTEQEEI